jgi:hypothetical protein
MGWVSSMKISSSQGLKKPPKISPLEKNLTSELPQPLCQNGLQALVAFFPQKFK